MPIPCQSVHLVQFTNLWQVHWKSWMVWSHSAFYQHPPTNHSSKAGMRSNGSTVTRCPTTGYPCTASHHGLIILMLHIKHVYIDSIVYVMGRVVPWRHVVKVWRTSDSTHLSINHGLNRALTKSLLRWASNSNSSASIINMGVSKNRGIPKWMVYNGKPY